MPRAREWLTAAALPLAGAGCATSRAAQISTTPERYDVTCTRSADNCFERAAEECGRPYRVLWGTDSERVVNYVYSGSATTAGPTTYGSGVLIPVTRYDGEIIVECVGPRAQHKPIPAKRRQASPARGR